MTNGDDNGSRQVQRRQFLRRPLVGIGIAFMAGTWIGLHLSTHVAALCGIVVLLAVGALFLWRLPIIPLLCIHGLFLVAAWLNAGLRASPTAEHPLAALASCGKTQVELMGVVTDEPSLAPTKTGKQAWTLPLQVEAVSQTVWRVTDEAVLLHWFPGKSPRCPRYGEKWQFSADITEPPPRLPNLPTRTLANASRGKFISSGNGSLIVEKCLEARADAARILCIGIEDYPASVATINSLLLGYRSQMPQYAYRAYAATGTIHIFAIDGFHVVVQAAVIIFALGAFGIPRTRWILFLGPLLILYTVMTGLPPSALRACVMAIIYWSAPLLGRRSDVYTALAASAILILAFVPADLLSLGFILSFVVVLGLTLLYPVFARPLQRLFAPDPLRLQPEPRWILLLRAVWSHLSVLIATSLAAWLVSAPLTAYYFQMFSIIALAGNLIAMPLAALMIVTGALSLVFGSCIEFLADVFNHANLALAFLLTRSMEFFAAIPGGNFPVDPPPIWLILVFYFVLAILAARYRSPNVEAKEEQLDSA